jgi:hypothetical protein
MRFWGPEGEAAQLHHLRAVDRGQSGEDRSCTERGLDNQPQGRLDVDGCLASLSRFISRLGELGMLLYKLLKKFDHFQWTNEVQEAFD